MDSVSICNLALNMLGIPTITSFDDQNNNAKLCKRFFPVIRDRVLRDHSWSFAATGTTLQQLTTPPFDPDYQYACALPGDLIRIIGVTPEQPYRKAGRSIFVNELPATLFYVRCVEDSDLFDETFCEALQYALAAEIAGSSTQDLQKVNYYRTEYQRILSLARSIDSQENRYANQLSPRRSNFIAARSADTVSQIRPGKINWVEGNAGKQV